MELLIGKCNLVENEKTVSLKARVTYGEEEFNLEYEYDIKCKEYVVYERADAFLVSLIPYAMIKARKDKELIVRTETPISLELYHQLVNYQIPVLARNISYYSEIKIVPNVDNDTLSNKGAVATGVSCGVDSSYTIAKYACDDSKIGLTHGVFFNLGVYDGFYSEAEKQLENRAKAICDEVGIEFLMIKHNMIESVYTQCFGPIVPHVMMGGILSLQKLFDVYYLSAEVAAEETCFSDDYACFYDWLSASNYSTKSTRFYCSGIEAKRLEKIKYISKYDFAQKYLSVCTCANEEAGNCSVCAKCTSAMASLDALGVLKDFSDSFNVDYFYENPDYYLSYVLMKDMGNDLWCSDIVNEYKKNGKIFSKETIELAEKKWKERGNKADNPNKIKFEDLF